MFAGRMKLKTFLLVFGGLGALLFAGGTAATAFFGASVIDEVTDAPPAPAPALASAPADPSPAAPAAPAADSSRPWDSVLLGKAGTSLGTDKVKDATGGTPYKVNLYQDAGESTMNRAKVDYDRDEKWDEKWTFAPDGIVRQVAPNDDEQYSLKYKWSGGAWVQE